MEAAGHLGCGIVTQNVDGFHQAAGSRDVTELHGSDAFAICLRPACGLRVPIEAVLAAADDDSRELSSPGISPMECEVPLVRWTPAGTWGLSHSHCGDEEIDIWWPLRRLMRQQLLALLRRWHLERRRRERRAQLVQLLVRGSAEEAAEAMMQLGSSDDYDQELAKAEESAECEAAEDLLLMPFARCMVNSLAAKHIGSGFGVPICPSCSAGLLKPDALFFGELLDEGAVDRAVKRSLGASVVLMIGTSGKVEPARSLPLIARKDAGARIVELNPGETELSAEADLLLRGTAAALLPRLASLLMAVDHSHEPSTMCEYLLAD
eukprot:gnl/TRDRNA2_/TRDRNA2_139032_c0_seq1.p1 gnl/TRDRNA2_/TRDRNA2_139032_c0~~gnl/TRDRNA2_/TRDRNA2_139032_c0_seq1.p1  ORF type:complete len:322 (+),score=80.89 gnl/TRDRNA2_/TRDRNA2_139032_c0_seq1:300-1265(+)